MFVIVVEMLLVLNGAVIDYASAHDDGNDMTNYICPNDELVKNIVQERTTNSMSLIEKAKALYDYVANNIDYKSDKEVWRIPDYWQFPSTTIKKRTGDCEDQAMLLTSLLRCAGFPREQIHLVYGKLVSLVTGKLQGYHCWIEIKPSTEQLAMITQLYKSDLEELAGKNVTIHTNDGDITFTIDENKLQQYMALGLGERNGWIPLDTTFEIVENKVPTPFWTWMAFGYYMYYIGLVKAEPLEFYVDQSPPTKLILSMEKEEYKIGETITFTVTNTGTETIYFPNTASFTIYHIIKSGFQKVIQPIYTPIGLQVLTPLNGSESRNFSWDQKNNDRNQVTEGEYMIVIDYYENEEGRQISKSFRIVSPSYEWIYSGSKFDHIMFENKSYYVGIKSKICIPKEMEFGEQYNIPIYFKRENIYKLMGESEIYDLPLDIKIFSGFGIANDGKDFYQICIKLNDDINWCREIPLKKPVDSSVIGGNTILGELGFLSSTKEYTQKAFIQLPPYQKIADIPTEWDGPYNLTVKMEYSPSSRSQPVPSPIVTPVSSPKVITAQNLTTNTIKITDTPFIMVNHIYPNTLNLKTGLAFGSQISRYNIITEGNTTYLTNNKHKVKVEVPISIKNSKLLVKSPLPLINGQPYISINIAPEDIIVKEKISSVKHITLKMDKFTPVYEIKGKKSEKLLGIIKIKEPITIKVDAVTGKKLSTKEPWWGFLT